MSSGPARTGEARRFEASDNVELAYRAWPVAEPRAAVFVVHGMFEYSRRYEELAAVLNDADFSVFAVDLRGHGDSGGTRGYSPRFGQLLDDVHRFCGDAGQALDPDVPRVLLAHSMGGLIGIRYLEEYQPPFLGAVITSPWLGLSVEVPAWQRIAARVFDRLIPKLPFPSDLDPNDLSHDPERVADYVEDPVIHSTMTPRLWEEVGRAIDRAFEDVGALDLPLLFLLAGDDRVVDTARTLALIDRVPATDVTTRVLEGYFHEVLQETDRAAVMAEIRAWIEARLP